MKDKSGFTLIEIILSIVVFSIGVVGIMVVFSSTLGKTSDPIIRHKGIQVAQSVMDVILTKKFDNDTPNGGGIVDSADINIGKEEATDNPMDFDDVDDYVVINNCNSGTTNCFSSLSKGYKIKVEVNCAKVDTSLLQSDACPQDYKLITVKVAPDVLSGETYILKAVKGNF